MKKRNLVLFIFATILFASYLIYQNLSPLVGIYVTESEQNDLRVVGFNDWGWGWDSEIETNDVIVLIDGEKVQANHIVNEYRRIEQANNITVEKNGTESTYHIDYSSFFQDQVLIYLLFPSLFFLLCVFLSFTLVKNYSGKSVSMLIILNQLLGLGYIGSSLSLKLFSIGLITVDFTLLITPILFLHFIYYFMKEKEVILFSKKFIYLLYLFAIVIFIDVTFSLTRFPIKKELLMSFMLILIIIIGLLIKSYYVTKDNHHQRAYKWILKSLLFALAPYTLFYVIPNLIWGINFVRPEIALAFIFIIPIVFLYLLLTGKMYLIKIYIKRLAYYIALAVMISIPIIGVNYFISQQQFKFSTISLSLIFTILLLLVSFHFKNHLDRVLRSSLFLNKRYYQESLFRFSERLKDENSTAGILDAFKREVTDVLYVHNPTYQKVNREMNVENVDTRYQSLFKKAQKKRPVIGEIMLDEKTFCISVGKTDNKYIIFFGTLTKSSRLNSEENDWLSTLAYYTNISLENVSKIEDLLNQLEKKQTSQSNWVNRLIFNWSENERIKLASDIHDSFLQNIIHLKRKLSNIEAESDRINLNEILLETEQDLEDIIYEIKETQHELSPPLLREIGLEASLGELTNKFNLRVNIQYSIYTTTLFDEELLSLEYKHMIFRTIQELFNNAAKHSKASEATVTLNLIDDEIELLYNDDGIGMPPNINLADSQHMGLLGMKNRINSFGGVIQFDSETQRGLSVIVQIPITTTQQMSLNY